MKTAKLNFDYFIFLLKLNKRDSSQSGVKSGKRKNKSAQLESDPVIFANPEEEYLMEVSSTIFIPILCYFSFLCSSLSFGLTMKSVMKPTQD